MLPVTAGLSTELRNISSKYATSLRLCAPQARVTLWEPVHGKKEALPGISDLHLKVYKMSG